MINFYRRFLPDIAKVLLPLTEALKGNPKTLVWPPAVAAAKAPLVAAVPLAHPAPDAVLSLATDASDTHVGGVLQQLQGGSWQPKNRLLFKEAVGGRTSVFHLRQGAPRSLQRHPTLQVPAGRASVQSFHGPQAAGHRPFPHHASLVGKAAAPAVADCRVYF